MCLSRNEITIQTNQNYVTNVSTKYSIQYIFIICPPFWPNYTESLPHVLHSHNN
jgi:hypothetical protein